MKEWRTVRSAPVQGGTLVLKERSGEFLVQIDGKVLMSSRRHGSEEALAEVACGGLKGGSPRVLIGGLGLGYSLRAALNALPARAQVTVAEISAELVDWNRSVLAELAGRPLEDARVRVEIEDVGALIRGAANHWDSIALDTDNGPVALTRAQNASLYSAPAIAAARRALRPGGVFAVWSASPDVRFEARLRQGGFQVEVRSVAAVGRRGGRHTLFVAREGRREDLD